VLEIKWKHFLGFGVEGKKVGEIVYCLCFDLKSPDEHYFNVCSLLSFFMINFILVEF
jgi:hypothetical protein